MELGSPRALGNGSVLGSFPKPQGNGLRVQNVGFGAGPGAERGGFILCLPTARHLRALVGEEES